MSEFKLNVIGASDAHLALYKIMVDADIDRDKIAEIFTSLKNSEIVENILDEIETSEEEITEQKIMDIIEKNINV